MKITLPASDMILASLTSGKIAPLVVLPEADKLRTTSAIADHYLSLHPLNKIAVVVHNQERLDQYRNVFLKEFKHTKRRLSIIADNQPKYSAFSEEGTIQLATITALLTASRPVVVDVLIFDDFSKMDLGKYAQLIHRYRANYPVPSVALSSDPVHLLEPYFKVSPRKTSDPVDVLIYDDLLNAYPESLRPEEREALALNVPEFSKYWGDRADYESDVEAILCYIRDLHQHRIKAQHLPKWCIFEIAEAFIKNKVRPPHHDEIYFAMYQVAFGKYTERPDLFTIKDIEAMAESKEDPEYYLRKMRGGIAEAKREYPRFFYKKRADIDKENGKKR